MYHLNCISYAVDICTLYSFKHCYVEFRVLRLGITFRVIKARLSHQSVVNKLNNQFFIFTTNMTFFLPGKYTSMANTATNNLNCFSF